jgi:hypothetical protein
MYRPRSSEKISDLERPERPSERCCCWAKARTLASTTVPSASMTNSCGTWSGC